MIRPTSQFRALFNQTTVPVLEQVVKFDEARQNLLAGNIANYDTPGYAMRDIDVSEFKGKLARAIEKKNEIGGPTSVTYPYGKDTMEAQGEIWPVDIPILYHDDNNVGMEYQVTEMSKNNMEFDTAIGIMRHQMNLLQTAISERV
ncbi:MAG: flagellar basal body rod protein FlgB [Planctomycetaceae bacterium]|jgi:flagellar basal-body rod protein FlgB|nr:flagellar basal body rod protein FlgB [Planctomycetaceae bacterium]